MILKQLPADLLYAAVIQACRHLIAQRQHLNAINVFPVADGDTGDNMAATARAIITHAQAQADVISTCTALANAGILGARGNSGMIFSQFFNGMLEAAPLPQALDTVHFASMMQVAVSSVRSAIANPVEGTIITVMSAWAGALHHLAAQQPCFIALMQQSLDVAAQALQSTTTTLAVLQKAQVVDAGALGFYLFLEGFNQYLRNPQPLTEEGPRLQEEPHQHEVAAAGEIPHLRYCTEAILHTHDLDKDALRQALQTNGDSIVLSANSELCRLHVHCNEPWKVFSMLQTLGQVQYPKVDDMRRQYETVHARHSSIALVTDTSANLPQALMDAYQVHLLSLNVHFDQHDLLDRHSFDPHHFYDDIALLKTYPRTSFPAPAVIKDKIAYLARHYEHVLVLSVSQALSGAHDSLVNIAKEYSNVHIVNSRQVAGGQGLLVHYAGKLIEAGLPIETIKQKLLDKISKTYLFVMVDQFDSLIRSGRISRFKGKLAQFSGVKPILMVDKEGKAIIHDKAFSETKALVKLVKLIEDLNKTFTLDDYCLIHAGVEEKTRDFAQMTSEAFQKEPLFIEPVSTAIGLHAGKGCIAIAATML